MTPIILWLFLHWSPELVGFVSATLCGVSIQNFQIPTNLNRDIQHHLITTYFYSQAENPQAFIIQNSQTAPSMFKTMTYSCYLYVFLNLENNFFSKLHLMYLESNNFLYKRGRFLVVTPEGIKLNISEEQLYEQLDKENKVIVVTLQIRQNTFDTSAAHFLCAFCNEPLLLLNTTYNVLNTSLTDHKANKMSVIHFWGYYGNVTSDIEKIQECSNVSFSHYMNPLAFWCSYEQLIFQLIVQFSQTNITLQAINANLKRIPLFFRGDHEQLVLLDIVSQGNEKVQTYQKEGIMYCIYNDPFQRMTDMWIMNVESQVWILLFSTIFVIAVLRTIANKPKLIKFQFLLVFLKHMWDFLRILLRQTSSEKSINLAAIEFIVFVFLSAYENTVTVQVIVPGEVKPFSSLQELYKENYTFVVLEEFMTDGSEFLLNNFNRNNKSRVVKKFFEADTHFVMKYMFKGKQPEKYAVLDPYIGNNLFKLVTELTKNFLSCYTLYPREEAFHSKPTFYSFFSPFASQLKDGLAKLQAAGLEALLDKSLSDIIFHENMIIKRQIKSQLPNSTYSYDLSKVKQLFHEDDPVRSSLIYIGNLVLFLYCAGVLIILGLLMFFLEVGIFYGLHRGNLIVYL